MAECKTSSYKGYGLSANMVIWFLKNQREWFPVELTGEVKIGSMDGSGLVVKKASEDMDTPYAVLSPWQERGITMYVLFPVLNVSITVNGYTVTGIKVLNDRDEIIFRYPGQSKGLRAYFSTESLPVTAIYGEGHDHGVNQKPIFCVRCKGKIESGQQIVKCPRCKLIYHEMDERGCWTYDRVCAGCQRPTDMDYSWRPEPIIRKVRRPYIKEKRERPDPDVQLGRNI